MANTQLLKAKIVEKNMTQEEIAHKSGISRSSFYRKMKNKGGGFTLSEARKIVDTLTLSNNEIINIFF